MAQLGSPGVQVNVIDESFYNPATPGTIPLVLVATAQDKANASGTGIALGTTLTNANSLYLATSQKDLTDRFGVPIFQKDASGSAIQGSELNEYGLFAAYSYLGASNSAYILRASVDLGAISGNANVPVGNPVSSTYWLDTSKSRFGIFEWNAALQQFVSKTAITITSSTDLTTGTPKTSVGTIGDYAIVTTDTSNPVWYKNTTGAWVKVGTKGTTAFGANSPAILDWTSSWPVKTSRTFTNGELSLTSATYGMTITVTTGAVSKVATVSFNGSSNAHPTVAEMVSAINDAFDSATPSAITNAGARVNGNTFEMLANDEVTIAFGAGSEAQTLLQVGAASTSADIGITAGTYRPISVQFSDHTKLPFWTSTDASPRPNGSVWFKTTEFNLGAKWAVKSFNGDTLIFETKDCPVYSTTTESLYKMDPLNGGSGLAVGALYVDANFNQDGIGNFKIMYRANSGVTKAIVTVANTTTISSVTVKIAETVKGSSVLNVVEIVTGVSLETLRTAINNSSLTNVTADYIDGQLVLTHSEGGEIFLDGAIWGTLGYNNTLDNVYTGPSGTIYDLRISNWKPLSSVGAGYFAQGTQPTDAPADGTIWYSTYQDKVDIMVHNGTDWKGLQQVYPQATVIVQASKPSNLSRRLGDIWVDTSSQDNYGRTIKRWNVTSQSWDGIDVTDHTSQYGIIFADARWATAGTATAPATIDALANSDYVDFDCPDPTAYPRGMLLWNTRRSGFNIKQYKRNYVNTSERNVIYDEAMTSYFADRWVSISGSDLNQVAHFGRKAQRAYVVGQLKVAINTNQRILDEDNIYFNLIAAPGYPELISDMVNLNNSRNATALVVGDTPLRLGSTASDLINYGTDYYNTGIDGEAGLHTESDHLAVYYPSGLTTDLSGSNVVVPSSHMMLRTIAVSDQKAFQWFAPAGTRRGGITNATSVGYLKDGSFIPVSLNQGVRDQMAQVKINPVTNIPGAGLVAFGQYTKTGTNSSLDRINVSRLVSYLRRQLSIITRPFLFEPNDKQTRSEIKNVCESLMLDLVSLRGVYDFIVICDETNNTSSVISNNQLYVDIAVEPVKAVEFIYIPLRLKNVGDIKSRQ
jgi:hypothetical protein